MAAGEGNKGGSGGGWLFVSLMKIEFWILGVVGEGQRRNTCRKQIIQPGKLTYEVLLHWAKQISQTPKYSLVRKITKRPSSLRLANTYNNKGIGYIFCPICL